MKFDTTESGLETVFTKYMVEGYRYVLSQDGVTSRDVWEYANQILEGSISRASIINGLNDMVEMGILSYEEQTGKGGYHRVYFAEFDEQQLLDWMILEILKKLDEINPNSKVLKEIKHHWMILK